ncbi:MAG: GAF domain-containing protein [Anaerolineae bacterium]|nr:GAF domain-containing protein [Anaerolineae bacterium]
MKRNKNLSKPSRTLHQQVMQRVSPIVIVMFVLGAMIAIFLYWNGLRTQQMLNSTDLVTDRADTIERTISAAGQDLSTLANSAAARSFASEAALGRTSSTLTSLQVQLLRSFVNTVTQNLSFYRSIRFITAEGSTWTQVTNLNGAVTPDIRQITAENFTDAFVHRALILRETQFAPNNADSTGQTMRVITPVTDPVEGQRVLGVIEAVFVATDLKNTLVPSTDGQEWLLVNSQGQPALEIYFPSLATTNSSLAAFLNSHLDNVTMADYGGSAVSIDIIDFNGVSTMPWKLVLIDRTAVGTITDFLGIIAIIIAAAVACFITLYLLNRVLRERLEPLAAARTMAFKLAEGESYATLPVHTDNDEVTQLNDSFSRISYRLNSLASELDERLEEQRRRVETASYISREMSAATETGELMNRAIDLMCEAFKMAHAQIFLLDDIGLNALLAYSRGLAGKRLLEQRHYIPVGSATPVGSVTATGQPVVISNTRYTGGLAYVPQPLLTETRAEIVLPLNYGGHVIGALDLHSNATRNFTEDEVALYQMLADQLALAIQKTREIGSIEQQLEQGDTLNRQLTRTVWEETGDRLGLADAYRYNLVEVAPLAESHDDQIAAISAPITIRGEVIGTIAAAAPEGMPFVEGDHAILRAVADRVGLAIEGARLFNETQTSLSITSTLYELSRRLNEANDLSGIIQAVISSVAPDAHNGQIWLLDDADPNWLQLSSYWSADDATLPAREQFQLHVAESGFLNGLRDLQVKLINDVSRDRRLDSELKSLLQNFTASAAIFIPFSARGQWRGMISLLFPQVRQFKESEGRVYSALVDQAGVAIDNRLLTEQTELTLDQIERLYAASRAINTAQNPVELVRAVLSASADSQLRLELGILEGQLDSTGWPTLIRMVARSENGLVTEVDTLQAIQVDPASPLRKRDTQTMPTIDGSTHIFPLFSANQPIAMLYLHLRKVDELSTEDYEIYKALAGQMSTVLENQRLLQQTSLALDETRRLYTASRAITGAQDSAEVYAAATTYLAQPMPELSRIEILLAGPVPEPHAPYYDMVHVWSLTGSHDRVHIGARLTADEIPVGKLLSNNGESVYYHDLQDDTSTNDRLPVTLSAWGSQSAVVVPLRTQRNWLGVLIAESDQPDAFNEQYIRYAQAVVDQIAVAVENRLLFEEARSEAQRALALAEVGQLASQVGAEFEQNISQVFSRVAEPASYDRWLLTLINEDDPNRLDKITWENAEDNAIYADVDFNLRSSDHALVDAIRLNRMLIINDPFSYPAYQGMQIGELTAIGKHIIAPIYNGLEIIGALLVGRGLDQPDLDERDEQLVRTLVAQVAVAIENRRLYQAAEQEREYLRSILETMPTGIVVIDPQTLKPIQANAQAESLLGRPINYSIPFNVTDYNLIRTGTNVPYPQEEMPINVAVNSGGQAFSDDIAALHDAGDQTDLLLNAAPIYDARGNISAIVAAFQDISNLRGLENTLQNSLREQIALYEATRSLSEAKDVDEALDAAITQLIMLDPIDGYIVLLDEQDGSLVPVRGILSPEQFSLPQELFHADPFIVTSMRGNTSISLEIRQQLIEQGVQALATIPMKTRDILEGWIAVLYDRVLDFSSDNERFLTTLADNAAVAIDNRNLQRRTEMAFEEATTLYETSRSLTSVTNAEEVVGVAVTKLRMAHISQIFMAVPSSTKIGSDMVVVANWQRHPDSGINLLGVTLNAEQFPSWRQASTDTLLTIDDTLLDESLDELERMGLESTNTRSLAVIPLRSGNRRLGVLWLSSETPYRHTERDRRIYQSFAEQASLSMEATRLFEQTERRARQLSTSAEVSQIANSILDVNVLLPRLVDLIRDAFNYDHVQIFLMDGRDQFAELRASTGEAGRQLLSINHRLAKGSKSVIGQVTATGESVIALDTADARVIHKPNPYLPLTRSEMALPLISKGRVVGALDVQSNTPAAFSDEDVTVLGTLANQISTALENARLFEQAENRARDMSFLFGATTAASAAEKSLRDALQDVAELVQTSLSALNTSIYLTEQYTDQYGEAYSMLRPVALAGSEQPISELSEILVRDEQNLLSAIALSLQPRLIANLEEEPTYLPVSTQAKSVLAAPMSLSNQLIGIIVLEDEEINHYDQQTVNLIGALTNSLSTIIQNNRLLEQVQRSNDQLRELDRVKSDFLANMSHELRTPLNSIIGFSRVILKGIDGPLTEMQEQDLSTIYNSGTHLLGLINDILDQAKISSGKMDVHPDYFDMKPVVEGVRSIGIGLIKDKPVDLKLDIESGLPKVYGDEFRTRQVLLNLVSNASKFTQQGSIHIRVYLDHHIEADHSMLRVDVQDSGIGIAEKDIPLLFEAFRQVDSSLTRTVGGTGLGLPIAKSLIEMQGGKMLVHSQVNVGSVFSILLPLEPLVTESPEDETAGQPSDAHNTTELPAVNGAADSFSNGVSSNGGGAYAERPRDEKHSTMTMSVVPPNRQILLIEDSPDMVDQFRRALQRESFDIFSASIPLEAEAMASGLRPMLIIMSADFAKGMAWDILRRLQEREDTCDIPVILVALENVEERALNAGAFTFLQRPFIPEQLVEVVKKAEQISQTERILIIDDQEESSRFLRFMLDESGHYRVFTARSAQEGISLVARRRPDLVILDLRMPEKDGFAVLDELRSNPETASIPIMIVTADTVNAEERDRLGEMQIIYKTDLTQENYASFIDGVREHLGHI